MLKKLVSFFIAICLVILPNLAIYASEINETVEREQYVVELQVEVDELINLEENMEQALNQLEKMSLSRTSSSISESE